MTDRTEYCNKESVIKFNSDIIKFPQFIPSTEDKVEHFIIHESRDGGKTWKEVGRIDGPFKAQVNLQSPKIKHV